jgi:hypothetical protein
LPLGADRRDPGLSTLFAPRESLPKSIFMLGVELDILGQEAWRAACRWGGRWVPEVAEVPGKEEVVGKGELVLDDERFAWEDKASGVRWLLVPDTARCMDLTRV